MEREQVIALALEAGLIHKRGNLDVVQHSITQIERFAALVEQRVRSEIALDELAKLSQELGGY